MRRLRGRPRHDDVLTPREWEVLDLLKRGLTNAEIAGRLGISFDTAKFHVSEIITKLGVENREQAAAWRGQPRLQFGWAPTLGAFQRLAAVGAVVVAVAAAVVLLWKQPDRPAVLLPPGIYIAGANGDALPRVDLTHEPVETFDWSEGGSAFETTSQTEGEYLRVSRFDSASGTLIDQTDVLPTDEERRDLSPDGQTYTEQRSSRVEVRDAATGSLLASIEGYGAGPFNQVWSPDSNWLALMQGPYQTSTELRVISRQPGVAPHIVTPAVTPLDFNNGFKWLDWAPDSRSLAFVRDGRIWSLDVATGDVRQIASGSFPVLTEPRWSPDGSQLAFRSASIASGYVATIDGKSRQYLAPVDSAAISPDGKRVATLSAGILTTQRSDGSDPKVVGDFSSSHIEFMTDFFPSGYCGMQFPGPSLPAWSPDGKHLLVAKGDGDSPVIYLIDPTGSRSPVAVAKGYEPGWSPDGKHISFVHDCGVHILPFDGSDAAENGITIEGYVYEWRQDGNILAGKSSLGRGTQPDGIGIYDANGALLKTFAGNATLSPNGDLIALTTGPIERAGARFFQTVIQATSSGQILWTLDNVSFVTFSPNGKWIAFQSFVCCEAKLHVLDVSSPGSTPQLLLTARSFQQLVWSPDSHKVAFTHRLTEQSDNDILAVFDFRSQNLTTIAPDASGVRWFSDSERILFNSGPR